MAEDSDRPELWNERGSVLAASGSFERALECFQLAAALGPKLPGPACNVGQTLLFLGRPTEGLPWLDRAVALQPTLTLAHALRADALQALGRHVEARDSCRRALMLGPQTPELRNAHGVALAALESHAEAVQEFDLALRFEPAHLDALSNRGISLLRLGRYADSIQSLNRALAVRADHAGALNTRGNALAALGRVDEALASFEEALKIWPDFLEALISYGSWLVRIGRVDEGSRALRRAVELNPRYPDVAGAAFDAAARCCDWSDHPRRAGAILEGVRDGRRVAAPFHMLIVSDSPADQLACARLWVRERFKDRTPEPQRSQPARKAGERLKIAYLSPDFRGHPVARQACGLFERHDRARFETMAVAFGRGAKTDPVRLRLESAFERFIEVPDSVSDREVAQHLRDLGVAIAVDLAGFTTDARPGLLALRPASVQVSFLGYPGTLGADCIDYILADGIVLPPEQSQFYSERVVRMPDSFFVTDDLREIGTTPHRREVGLPDEAFVYCCFNHPYKLTPTVFDAWMLILQSVADSVLWLSEPTPIAADNLKREAFTRGVAPERLIFAPRLANVSEYLARLRLADLFLDTLPYNAHATACDALWAGLPVLSRLGHTFAGRVAASLLHAAGVPELVVESKSQYIATAVEMARDRALLSRLRARLATAVRSSRLFDTDRFRRHLEWAYQSMWERYSLGEPPADFDVPAM